MESYEHIDITQIQFVIKIDDAADIHTQPLPAPTFYNPTKKKTKKKNYFQEYCWELQNEIYENQFKIGQYFNRFRF